MKTNNSSFAFLSLQDRATRRCATTHAIANGLTTCCGGDLLFLHRVGELALQASIESRMEAFILADCIMYCLVSIVELLSVLAPKLGFPSGKIFWKISVVLMFFTSLNEALKSFLIVREDCFLHVVLRKRGEWMCARHGIYYVMEKDVGYQWHTIPRDPYICFGRKKTGRGGKIKLLVHIEIYYNKEEMEAVKWVLWCWNIFLQLPFHRTIQILRTHICNSYLSNLSGREPIVFSPYCAMETTPEYAICVHL